TKCHCEAGCKKEDEERARKKQREEEKQRKKTEERLANVSEWESDHRHYPFPDELPAVRDSLALLAMIDIMDKTDNESFGPLDELDYTLSASGSADVESLKNLHRLRWIAPTLPA